jgi:hypothetical protein
MDASLHESVPPEGLFPILTVSEINKEVSEGIKRYQQGLERKRVSCTDRI